MNHFINLVRHRRPDASEEIHSGSVPPSAHSPALMIVTPRFFFGRDEPCGVSTCVAESQLRRTLRRAIARLLPFNSLRPTHLDPTKPISVVKAGGAVR